MTSDQTATEANSRECAAPDCPSLPALIAMHEIESGHELHTSCLERWRSGGGQSAPAMERERDAVRTAVGGVLFNVSNFPERVQSRLGGQNMGPLMDKVTDAVLAALPTAAARPMRMDEEVERSLPHGVPVDDAVTRLSVNLAPTVAAALKDVSREQGISLTEAIRRAIALLKLTHDAQTNGQRIMLVAGQGRDATYREILLT